MGRLEKGKHPGSAWGDGHKRANDFSRLALSDLRGLFSRSDILPLARVVGHVGRTPVIRSSAFWPPILVSAMVLAPAASI